jgi:hypothetical protein
MKKSSTIFARIVIFLVGIAALAVCFILLPELAREDAVGKPASANFTFPFLATAYIVASPFFLALYQTSKLLQYIDKNKAFSKQSIKTLQKIKACAIVFCVLVVTAVIAGISITRSADPKEDITFMVSFGFICVFVASVIAVFVAVLKKLVTDAVALKSENDLTV